MNKRRVKYRSDNHGLTLIELIVTIGIIGIFIGVVSTFLSTTSNTYRGTSSNSKVQMETQETFDKLEDVIINANRNLAYGTSSGQIGDDINGKDGACSTVSKIFMVSSGEDSDVVNLSEEDDDMPAVNSDDTVMTATAENGSSFGSESGENVADKAVTSNSKADDETVRDYFIWDQSSGEVRYIHSEKVNGQWQNYNEDPNGDLLATGVMDFRADISKAVTDKIVRFQLRTKSGTKTIETLHSVSLRNDLGVSSQIDSPFVNPTGAPKPSVKPTDTPVPTEPPKPTGLTLNKSTVLLAAGTSLNMSNMKISGTVNYDDGTTSTAGNLSWTIDSNCTYATLNGGVIHIQENAGTAETGTVTITVTDMDHDNVYCTLSVSIARIDLTMPEKNAVYKVGNAKRLTYTYMEGGTVKTGATVTTEQKPEGASDYSDGGSFTQSDIGSWKVKAAVNLSESTGYDIAYGVVEDVSAFTVVDSASDIIINRDASIDALVAGRTYDCMPTIQHGFNWHPVSDDILWSKDSKMRWGIKGNTDGISIDSEEYADPKVIRKITIADDVQHGFVIYADFTKDNGDGTNISVHAEKEIKVVNGIELSSLDGETAYAYKSQDTLYSKGYEMKLLLNIYDVDGKKNQLCVSKEDGTQVDWEELGSGGKVDASSDKKNWIFMPSEYDVNKTLQVTAKLQRVAKKYGIFDCDNNYYGDENENFKKSIPVKISEPEFTARIVPGEDEKIEPDETRELYLELLDKDGNAMDRDVTWSIQNGIDGHLSAGSTMTGENQKTVFSADKPGVYIITASYNVALGISHDITKTITVRKPEVKLTLHGAKTGYNGDTESYWLEAKVDGKTISNLQVTWKTDWAGNVNKPTSETGETGAVQVKFDAGASSCKITASVKVAGEDIEISENITLKKHEYTMTITAVNPETNEEIDSCEPGKTVQFVVRVYYDENEISNCQINWTTWGKNFKISQNTATYTVGKDENSLSFQIQAVSENKTQNAQVLFDKNGIAFTSIW